MSRANIAPEEVRQIASKLKSRAADVENIVSGLKSDIGTLGSAWQDEGFGKFKETIDQTVQQLGKFRAEAEKHAAFLAKKAGAAEEYLKVR